MTQTLYPGVDASTPGAPLPAGTKILAAYVGIAGRYGPDTPHIWTADEWNHYLSADPELRVLPIYTHNYPDGNPDADAADAVEAVEALGWAANLPDPGRRFIALDLEIMVNADYVYKLGEGIWNRGFRAIPYGSASYVTQNPAFAGRWEAILTRHAPTVLNPGQRGIQWSWGTDWDYDVFDQETYDGCGVGLRHG